MAHRTNRHSNMAAEFFRHLEMMALQISMFHPPLNSMAQRNLHPPLIYNGASIIRHYF
jgi:hypothetical protein